VLLIEYVSAPSISGAYGWDEGKMLKESLSSMVECQGCVLDGHTLALFVKVYDPEDENAKNPLACFPGGAKDLEGLTPIVVSTDELDPLRDKEIEFYRSW
jgi:hypothetical protein